MRKSARALLRAGGIGVTHDDLALASVKVADQEGRKLLAQSLGMLHRGSQPHPGLAIVAAQPLVGEARRYDHEERVGSMFPDLGADENFGHARVKVRAVLSNIAAKPRGGCRDATY